MLVNIKQDRAYRLLSCAHSVAVARIKRGAVRLWTRTVPFVMLGHIRVERESRFLCSVPFAVRAVIRQALVRFCQLNVHSVTQVLTRVGLASLFRQNASYVMQVHTKRGQDLPVFFIALIAVLVLIKRDLAVQHLLIVHSVTPEHTRRDLDLQVL